MATENRQIETTIKVTEDLRSYQYCAVATNDGKKAIGGYEASGILKNKPNTNEHATVAYFGEIRFKAGGAVTAGKPLTVDSNSTFVQAGSGFYLVGRAKEDVTSGSIGVGFFNFATPIYANTSDFIL